MDGPYSKKNMKVKDLNGSTLIISIIKLFVIWWICHTKVFWLLWMKPVWMWVKPLIQCFWKPWTQNWKEMSIIPADQLIQKKTKILLSGKILSSGIMQVCKQDNTILELFIHCLLVMSPSRAGLSHSSSWRLFGSARDLFPSAQKKSTWKSEIWQISKIFFTL